MTIDKQPAYTSGPWKLIIDQSGSGDEIYGFDISAANGRSIAYYDADDCAETEANARLIASAPCLLEALQEAVHEVTATIRCVTDTDTKREMQAVADKARSAIRSALGEDK